MGNTWVIDVRHYLDDNGQFAVKSGPARKLAEYVGEIIECVTSRPSAGSGIIPVSCRRRPGRKACLGIVMAGYSESDRQTIVWQCQGCTDQGLISGWQETQWDRRFAKPPK